MVEKIRPLIQQLSKGRAWNSSKNVGLCRTLSEACSGTNNPEYSNPMSSLLTKVKENALQITHLNNVQKAAFMSQNDVGWEDILDQAEDLYKEQMVEGLERWPPASNPKDSKKPPSNFQANLTQAPCPNNCNKKNDKKSKGKGSQDDNHSNGKKGVK